jgi:hypothetical protein
VAKSADLGQIPEKQDSYEKPLRNGVMRTCDSFPTGRGLVTIYHVFIDEWAKFRRNVERVVQNQTSKECGSKDGFVSP